MKSRRIAVLGIGRSGLAVARYAKENGAEVAVFDEGAPDSPRAQANIAALAEMGVPYHPGFEGLIPSHQFDEIVASPAIDMRKPILREAHRAGLTVHSEVEFAYRISKAPIIAITGTNGKSTTTVMTYCALREASESAVLCGNIYGSGYEEIPLTEAAAASTPDQVLVAEISSFQLEWVVDFRPRCAGITNISPDHLNRYDSFDQYAAIKRRIFDKMGEGDTIVANAGDTHTFPSNASLRDRGQGLPRVRFYGSAGVDASFDSHSLKLSVCEPVASLPFHERHNLLNACHASLLAASYLESKGVLNSHEITERVLQGLHNFRGLAHRMEHLGHKGGVEVINNSMCTNPAAIVASSSSIGAPQHLLVGGIKKNYDFKPVREYLDRSPHDVYLFGRDGAAISEEIGGSALVFSTMEEAFLAATERAQPGDVVMLAPGCASMDQFEDFVHRGEAFKKIAMEWLDVKET